MTIEEAINDRTVATIIIFGAGFILLCCIAASLVLYDYLNHQRDQEVAKQEIEDSI